MYLTPEVKQRVMKDLNDEIKNNNVDEYIIKYLKQINKLEQFCTTYCCVGVNKEGEFFGHKETHKNDLTIYSRGYISFISSFMSDEIICDLIYALERRVSVLFEVTTTSGNTGCVLYVLRFLPEDIDLFFGTLISLMRKMCFSYWSPKYKVLNNRSNFND